MKYIVYLTTNTKSQINGLNRIYVGVHRTENPDIFDGYLGCGLKIQHPSTYKYPKTPFQCAVKKYGPSAFKREVLFVYDTAIEAYRKEHDIVDEAFIAQSHVYNATVGGNHECYCKKLYQYDLEGNLVKLWNYSIDAYEFYGYDPHRWDSPKRNKVSFLDYYWSHTEITDFSEYKINHPTKMTYLYNKDGKMLKEFESQAECARYINYDTGELSRAIKHLKLVLKKYYVSNTLIDEFKPSPRKNYMDSTYYIYTADNKFLGKYKGKAIMNIIGLHSWDYMNKIFLTNNGWYKDYYLSESEVDRVPPKRKGKSVCVDVFTKYGDFIESMGSLKELREKYNVPSSKLKHIQQGDRYFENYIFRYSSK